MMHDFNLTEHHVVFMDLPIVFDLDMAVAGTGHARTAGTTATAPGSASCAATAPTADVRWFDIEPCYVFHSPNAYDDGDSIVLQAVRYPELWRDNDKWHTNRGFGTEGVMWRWAIDLDRGSVDEHQIDDQGVEFPRIDDRLAGLPARTPSPLGGQDGVAPVPRSGSLVRYDLDRGSAEEHLLRRPRHHPGAPGRGGVVPGRARGPTSSPAGTCPTCTTRCVTAATWSSSTHRTSPGNPLPACTFHNAYRTDSTVTGSPTDQAGVVAEGEKPTNIRPG